MPEIGQLPPAYRVPPAQPGKGAGQGGRAPKRKPDRERPPADRHSPRKPRDDDPPGIDEYA